jgi:methyl-accepting chemotaxis protein
MSDSLAEKYRPKNLPIYFQYRRFKWDSFFVGLFGALAVFGVLMKLWKKPFWGLISPELGKQMYEWFMPIGFLGECIVFIIMGFMKGDEYIEVFPDEEELEQDKKSDNNLPQGGIVVNMELPDSLRELIEEKVAAQLDGKLETLTNLLVEDVERTRNLLAETNSINSEVQSVVQSLSQLSSKLKRVGEGLSEFEKMASSNISENAQSVSERLSAANSELRTFEEEMRKLATRFKNFNQVRN